MVVSSRRHCADPTRLRGAPTSPRLPVQVAVSYEMPDGDYPREQEPTEDSWDAGDREVLCLVYLPDDTTTESVGDSGL